MSVYTPAVFAPADPATGWSIVREHPFGPAPGPAIAAWMRRTSR